jgi:hypothetical protein
MQDNYESPIHVQADVPWVEPTDSSCTRTFNQSDPCFVQWQITGTGPYSLSGGTLFSTIRSSVSWDNDTDILVLSAAGYGEIGFYPGFSRRVPMPMSQELSNSVQRILGKRQRSTSIFLPKMPTRIFKLWPIVWSLCYVYTRTRG